MLHTLKIKKPKIHGIMTSLAEQLDLDYSNEGDDYCLDLNNKHGRGYIRGIQFSHGLSVLDMGLTCNKKTVLDFGKQDVNLLQLLFNLDSVLVHDPTKTDENHNVSKLQYCMFSNDVTHSHKIILQKNKPYNVFIILINRKIFEDKLTKITSKLSKPFKLIFKDVNGVNYIHNSEYFSLEIAQYIEEFRQCELEEFMKPIFLEAKTYEILTHQLQNFNLDDNNKRKTLLRKSTIDKIENAVDIINDELDVTINVHQLAKRVGLNQNTLQNGFKNLFKTSVNDYIKNHRIDRAKILIENSNLNITEITYKIGINSRSYFSKLFKERFGISPSEYISNVRGEKNKSA